MLTPLAVQNEDVLRALETGAFTAKDTLAASLTPVRDPSNFRKTLARMEAEGLIEGLTITARARACLVAFDVAAGKVAMPAGMVVLRHGQIRQSKFNPRSDWESEAAIADLDSLRQSILVRGLRHNLQVRPTETEGEFEIIDGERRWRAIGLAIHDGDLPADFPVICLVKQVSDLELKLDAVDANVQNRQLSEIEEGRQFRSLRDDDGVTTAEIAERISKSQKYVQNRIRLTELPADLQARMELPKDDPEHLGYKAALKDHLIEKRPVAPKEPAPPVLELPPKLALALLELADKVAKFPAKISQPGFTELLRKPDGGALTTLNERKIVTFREEGGKWHAKILAHSSGALVWLTERGFYGPYPEDTLYGARKAVLSDAALESLEGRGLYATELLNVVRVIAEERPEGTDQVEPDVSGPSVAPPDYTADEEKAARRPKISAKQLMFLAEIAMAQRTNLSEAYSWCLEPTAKLDSSFFTSAGSMLSHSIGRLVDYLRDEEAPGCPCGIRLTKLGHLRLRLEGLHPDDDAWALYRARRAAGLTRQQIMALQKAAKFATPCLNVEVEDTGEEAGLEAEAPAQGRGPRDDEAMDETITPAQVLILAEIADKMMREPQRTSAGEVVAHVLSSVREDEAILKPLRWGGYLAYGHDQISDFYRTTELADRLLKAKGFHPLHAANAVHNARKFARRVLTGTEMYVTPWLNRFNPEANPVRHEPQHTPEALPPPAQKPSFMADLELHLMAEAFDRTSKRSSNALVMLLPTGDGAEPIMLLARNEDEARAIGAALAESGLYVAITIHARSGKLLMHWG